jgi:Protein of unknown function (DUF1573)
MRTLSCLILSITLVSFSIIACNNVDKNKLSSAKDGAAVNDDTSKYTTIQWIDSVKDYGKITEGQKLDVAFRFRNTGDKPLIIRSVQPGCGCTETSEIKEPIAPGAEGVIKASFNSSGRTGVNNKDIYVDANTKGTNRHTLHFSVEVVKASS